MFFIYKIFLRSFIYSYLGEGINYEPIGKLKKLTTL